MGTTESASRLKWLVEGLVIVVSILLAFGVDAWWDGAKEASARRALLHAIRTDLEVTRSVLAVSIESAEQLLARDQAFLSLADRAREVPGDSIESLIDAAFRIAQFQPALSSYRGAVSSGQITAVTTPTFLESLRVFERNLSRFEFLEDHRLRLFYGGYLFELTEELGSVYSLLGSDDRLPQRFQMTDSEFYDFVQRPSVYARIENIEILHRNVRSYFTRMDEALADALDEVEKLIAG